MVDEEFMVLHGLRLKGLASAASLEEAWGLVDAADRLEKLAAAGCCQYRQTPRMAGYMLLPPGREQHAALLDLVRVGLGEGALAALAGVYDRFVPVNGDFKALCSRWQMRGGAPNDHCDPKYDHDCVSALEELHGRFIPLVRRAGAAAPHFGSYRDRFSRALRRLVDDDDLDYFTKPLIDSYHTVWFEFHEDLIATLGRERQAHEA